LPAALENGSRSSYFVVDYILVRSTSAEMTSKAFENRSTLVNEHCVPIPDSSKADFRVTAQNGSRFLTKLPREIYDEIHRNLILFENQLRPEEFNEKGQ
jgi:hypothetical protein